MFIHLTRSICGESVSNGKVSTLVDKGQKSIVGYPLYLRRNNQIEAHNTATIHILCKITEKRSRGGKIFSILLSVWQCGRI